MSKVKVLATALAAGTLGVVGTVTGVITPVQSAQALTVYYTCDATIRDQRGTMTCGPVTNGEVRLRVDCRFAPDVYTKWSRGFETVTTGRCLSFAAGASYETRLR